VPALVGSVDLALIRLDEPAETRTVEKGRYSWVVGDEPYVSLHVMGSVDYAA
jgi:hypothetical protein